jgi:uncharacterized protein
MRFRRGARLDTGQVRDVRGSRVGGAGGLAMGGGGIGIVVLVVYLLVSALSGGGGLPGQLSPLDNQRVGENAAPSDLSQECKTGEDANQREDCRIVAVVNSVQKFWTGVFTSSGEQYKPSDTVFFTDAIDTGCGHATSQVGPFYCPADKLVYIDLGFFDELQQFGAEDTPFVESYVLAHEYGHHVQDQLGVLGRMRTQQGAKSDSVKTELMADCLAGAWARSAQTTTDAEGNRIIEDLTQDDIARAIDAAQAVGDDRIQKQSSGRVNPEAWTHGSSEQREHWFNVGLKEGSLEACNTFAPGAL